MRKPQHQFAHVGFIEQKDDENFSFEFFLVPEGMKAGDKKPIYVMLEEQPAAAEDAWDEELIEAIGREGDGILNTH